MEQGIFSEALCSVGCPVTVIQTRCHRRGANCCVFRITSSITDTRWTGA
jgi:predicted hydrocarbon binding protein